MRKGFHDVYELAKKEKTTMRTAAFMVALQRVGDAETQRGN